MSSSNESYFDLLRAHYETRWGELGKPIDRLDGRRRELPERFVVLEFPPSTNRAMWTYATCGMSFEMTSCPLELHIFCLEQSDDVVGLLFATAHYHRTGVALGLGHSVNFGKPWMDDSESEYGIVSLPYLDGPELENLTLDDDKIVKCYWLIPVTQSEVAYKKEYGLEKLEEKFEAMNFNYAHPGRKGVC